MWREPIRRRTEDLLRDFVARADELVRAQDQMQGLLGAVVSLTEDLSLEAVLDRVVQSACELVGARYGALGVIDDDHELGHFITVGIDDDGIRLIGDLPTGRGVLGHLIRRPEALRLDDLGSHEMASGFPPNHPDMKTFLGVPVRVRGSVFGNLYLTEKLDGGPFTLEDQELASALASAAGVAIENARLYEDTRRRQRWLEAGLEVSDLLSAAVFPGETDNLDLVAERALGVSDSILAVVAYPDADGTQRCRTMVGVQSLPAGQELPPSDVIAEVLETGASALVRDPTEVFGAGTDEKLGPLLVAALGRRSSERGLLILARPAGGPLYIQSDLHSSAVFGSRVGLALGLVRARQRREEQLLSTDRDRIARDLHDLVIQRLFGAGLSMQSLRRYIPDPVAQERISAVTAELDGTIHELRDTIYSMRTGHGEKEPLTGLIMRTIHEGIRNSEFSPKVQLTGPVDEAVPDVVVEQLLPVLSEGLSNAVRHSGADEINISLTALPDCVELNIMDNGCGFENPTRVSGLDNMKHRAMALGGECTIKSRPGHGTRLTWTAPSR
ncbi:GAF domain-containing sensor histidine kinase [Arthrobacter oryzae]|uniref:GAF domain-containing sensor histidine kinase n=1 Tax=Arthrobacter oryzae TaxID=409290 RepID=UPI00273B2B6C|nr:GAF domain-containing sensor histidine kinase [Arthrobacter oryzae]WLQ07378.1 GAF domain-containing protein [Arthrobacter oryzae]